MSATLPKLGTFTFEDGHGPPKQQRTVANLVQNPSGGGPGVVLVPMRGIEFPATLRGGFSGLIEQSLQAMVNGVPVNYIKDGVTLSVLVLQADVTEVIDAFDPVLGTPVKFQTCQFRLLSTT